MLKSLLSLTVLIVVSCVTCVARAQEESPEAAPNSAEATTETSNEPLPDSPSPESKGEPEQAALTDSEDSVDADPEEPANTEGSAEQKSAKEDETASKEPKGESDTKSDAKPDAKSDAKADNKSGDESKASGDKPGDANAEAGSRRRDSRRPEPVEPPRLPNIGASDTPIIPGQPWRVHDSRRPKPMVVTPGELSTYEKPGTPPSDAISLFDGTDLANWSQLGPDGPDDLRVPQWKVENGYFEVTPRTGTMQTIDSFGSCQLHIEWQSPEQVRGDSQNRGNSGIKMMQVYEIQVLDSFNNRTYADGYAGSMYGQYPPMVNATRKPGEWQVYDIIFEAPKYKDDGSVDEPAYLTLIHNGVLLHHRRAYYGPTGGRVVQKYNLSAPAAPIALQDHGSPVRYRNIWIRPLDL